MTRVESFYFSFVFIGLFLHTSLFSQSPEFAEMDEDKYIEITDYEKFARPKVLGRNGETIFVIDREIEQNRIITSTIYKIENKEDTKEVKVSPLNGNKESVINARLYDGMIFCYGYKWRGKGNTNTDQFIRIYDSNLNRIGEDIHIASMILNPAEMGLGIKPGFFGTIGAIPVALPIFLSDISLDENGNYAFWMTKLSTGPNSEQVKKMIKDGVIEGDKDDATEIAWRRMDMQLHFVNIDPNGYLQKNDSIHIEVEGQERKSLSGALINGCNFFGEGDGQVLLLDIWDPKSATGMNVFDDARFPWITTHSLLLCKIEDGKMINIYSPSNDVNYLTSNGYWEESKFYVKGFYALEGQTGWAGVYNLEFNEELSLQKEEFLPLEGNIDHESLNGDEAFTLRAMYKGSQGQIQNAQIVELEDDRKILVGELYTQITGEEYQHDKSDKPLGPRKYGNRIDTRVFVEDIDYVAHYYNKLVLFEIDENDQISRDVAVISKKQKAGTHDTNYMSYAASTDGSDLVIHFNDSKNILRKGYMESPSMYGGTTGKSHVLQEFRLDQDMSLKQIIYLKGTQRNLLPRARYEGDNGVIDLFSDKKNLLLYAW